MPGLYCALVGSEAILGRKIFDLFCDARPLRFAHVHFCIDAGHDVIGTIKWPYHHRSSRGSDRRPPGAWNFRNRDDSFYGPRFRESIGRIDVPEQNRELVASDPGHDIRRSYRAA